MVLTGAFITVWYYLLLPLAILVIVAGAAWIRSAAVALLVGACAALLLSDPWDPHNTLAALPIWIGGALAATGWRLRLPPSLCAAAFVLTLVVSRAFGEWPFLIKDGLIGLALLALLLAIKDGRLPKWWLTPGLVRMGRCLAGFSYSLYLTHAPVIFLTRTVLEAWFEITLPIRKIDAPALAIMMFECAGALTVAWLFYLAFERHTAALRAVIRARLAVRPPTLGDEAPPARSVQ